LCDDSITEKYHDEHTEEFREWFAEVPAYFGPGEVGVALPIIMLAFVVLESVNAVLIQSYIESVNLRLMLHAPYEDEDRDAGVLRALIYVRHPT
jgi:hypothetical protein